MFSYCNNSPITLKDQYGDTPETVFDIISLGSSVLDVVLNPTDPWAWAGLIGDAADVVIPFVGGIGEAVDTMRFANGVVQNTDKVIDAAKAIKQSVSTSTGAYEIIFKSGKNYVGKGSFDRAITSAMEHIKKISLNNYMGDEVVSITWKKCVNEREAFISEFLMQINGRGVLSADQAADTYKMIWSPGRK